MYRITAIISSEFDRVGVVGLSLGGIGAVQTNILNLDVYDVVAPASGRTSIHEQYAEQIIGHNSLRYYDYRDVLALTAPKPMYVSFGINERHIKDFEAVTYYTADYVKNAYRLHGAEENFVNVIDFMRNH